MVKIGIIGGSGLDNPNLLKDYEEIEVETRYGNPSSRLTLGKIGANEVVILARHGRKHELPPSQVNNRANIQALKDLGCEYILATTACGSLKKEIGRGDLVILDQFIDFTRHRKITFFEDFSKGVKHTSMAEPFDNYLREKLIENCKDYKFHEKGTIVTIEGPRFGTKAEGKMFQILGADVINMSIAPEAILANELGIKYAAIAMNTDYDSIFDEEEPVSWEMILEIFNQNSEKVKKVLLKTIESIKPKVDLKSKIRTIPDWPKPGIMFRDITTLLKDPEAMKYVIDKFCEKYSNIKIDKIVGIESRGFIFGSLLANELKVPLVIARKPGKLPGETSKIEYELEYGIDSLEIHNDAISSDDNVLIVDDLIAIGGTSLGCCKLVEKLKGKIVGCAFVIELTDLKGREKLKGYEVFSLVSFEGE